MVILFAWLSVLLLCSCNESVVDPPATSDSFILLYTAFSGDSTVVYQYDISTKSSEKVLDDYVLYSQDYNNGVVVVKERSSNQTYLYNPITGKMQAFNIEKERYFTPYVLNNNTLLITTYGSEIEALKKHSEIWIADGQKMIKIVSDLAYESVPVLSGNRTQIAFITDSILPSDSVKLCICDLSGKNRKSISSGFEANINFYPSISWSPTENLIAGVKNSQITTVRTDTQVETELTKSGYIKSAPSFSNDGNLIAYVEYTGTDNYLIVMDKNGNNRRMLKSFKYYGLVKKIEWSNDNNILITELMNDNTGSNFFIITNVENGESDVLGKNSVQSCNVK